MCGNILEYIKMLTFWAANFLCYPLVPPFYPNITHIQNPRHTRVTFVRIDPKLLGVWTQNVMGLIYPLNDPVFKPLHTFLYRHMNCWCDFQDLPPIKFINIDNSVSHPSKCWQAQG